MQILECVVGNADRVLLRQPAAQGAHMYEPSHPSQPPPGGKATRYASGEGHHQGKAAHGPGVRAYVRVVDQRADGRDHRQPHGERGEEAGEGSRRPCLERSRAGGVGGREVVQQQSAVGRQQGPANHNFRDHLLLGPPVAGSVAEGGSGHRQPDARQTVAGREQAGCFHPSHGPACQHQPEAQEHPSSPGARASVEEVLDHLLDGKAHHGSDLDAGRARGRAGRKRLASQREGDHMQQQACSIEARRQGKPIRQGRGGHAQQDEVPETCNQRQQQPGHQHHAKRSAARRLDQAGVGGAREREAHEADRAEDAGALLVEPFLVLVVLIDPVGPGRLHDWPDSVLLHHPLRIHRVPRAVEGGTRVLAGILAQDGRAPWVQLQKARDVVPDAVHLNPHVAVLLGRLLQQPILRKLDEAPVAHVALGRQRLPLRRQRLPPVGAIDVHVAGRVGYLRWGLRESCLLKRCLIRLPRPGAVVLSPVAEEAHQEGVVQGGEEDGHDVVEEDLHARHRGHGVPPEGEGVDVRQRGSPARGQKDHLQPAPKLVHACVLEEPLRAGVGVQRKLPVVHEQHRQLEKEPEDAEARAGLKCEDRRKADAREGVVPQVGAAQQLVGVVDAVGVAGPDARGEKLGAPLVLPDGHQPMPDGHAEEHLVLLREGVQEVVRVPAALGEQVEPTDDGDEAVDLRSA
mmetsp:Transcript_85889/g.268750  ORF Transcript_85889/g.268750 Transcript_85889/m.268750 type:complete len:686 (-) Transcript_85889:234-2291(-)